MGRFQTINYPHMYSGVLYLTLTHTMALHLILEPMKSWEWNQE